MPLNSKSSLIISIVFAALNIAASAFVFFSGYSTVRFIASIAFFVLERTDAVINTAQSGSLNVWGFCLYLDKNQNGEYQCTSLSLSKIFGGAFSLRPSITLPQRSGSEIIRIQDVINALPFQGQPIAYSTLLATMAFAAIAIVFGIVALIIKEKYPKGWTTSINGAAVTTTLSMLASIVNLVLTTVTTDAFINSINSNTSTLNMTAKWGTIGIALTATTTFLSIISCVFATRTSMIGQSSRKSRYLSGFGINVEDRFKDRDSAPNAPISSPASGYRSSAIDLYETSNTTTAAANSTTLSKAYHAVLHLHRLYHPRHLQLLHHPTTTATTPQQPYYGNYTYANQAYTTAAAAGGTSDYNTQVGQSTTVAPSTYLSNQTGSTNNQYATWQSPGYNPTTAEVAYQENYGHNVSETAYYARRNQPQQQNRW
ncbi:hypothetical protein BC829DRAFT_436961 [Chytridium lagenaria]|nr:hypothetical protein BC829DRAFT_436961 [Chytridium lagenaria]